MNRRYSIVGRRYGERGEGEIFQVDTNPVPLAHIAAQKRVFVGLVGKRRAFVNKYEGVRVIDRLEGTSQEIKYD